MGLLALLAALMLRLGAKVNGPHALRLALAHLSRERSSGLFQLAGFALALMLFGLLWVARSICWMSFRLVCPSMRPTGFWSMWPKTNGRGS